MKFPVPIPRPRRAEQTVLPAALAASLGLLLILQLAIPSGTNLPDVVVGRPVRLSLLHVAPLLAAPEITARPIFTPSRREDGSATAGDKSAPLEGARAVGAISVRGAARVFLQATDGRIVPISVGDSYRGWRLVRISGGQLLFIRGAESISLPISGSGPPIPVGQPRTDQSEEETQ
ncbi:MAG: hypothetical protein H7268_15045 [Sandarakinorhabdus sp.]|nr:hypothetical protein [Sandarakinorhabdus sp.]